jgi:hypothetical protein
MPAGVAISPGTLLPARSARPISPSADRAVAGSHDPGAAGCASVAASSSAETPVRGAHRERGLAHPAAAFASCPSSACRPVTEPISRGSVRVAAATPPVPPGTGRHGPALSGRLELRPGRAGQAQRIGQQPGGLLTGGPVGAPLQVTDRPGAQPGRLGQFLLRQPRLGPQPAQQRAETGHRLLRTGLSPPHRPSAVRTLTRGRHWRAHPGAHINPVGFLWASTCGHRPRLPRPWNQPQPDPAPGRTDTDRPHRHRQAAQTGQRHVHPPRQRRQPRPRPAPRPARRHRPAPPGPPAPPPGHRSPAHPDNPAPAAPRLAPGPASARPRLISPPARLTRSFTTRLHDTHPIAPTQLSRPGRRGQTSGALPVSGRSGAEADLPEHDRRRGLTRGESRPGVSGLGGPGPAPMPGYLVSPGLRR